MIEPAENGWRPGEFAYLDSGGRVFAVLDENQLGRYIDSTWPEQSALEVVVKSVEACGLAPSRPVTAPSAPELTSLPSGPTVPQPVTSVNIGGARGAEAILDTPKEGEAAVRLAVRNKPGGNGVKRAEAVEATVREVEDNRISYTVLARMKQKELSGLYQNAGRTLLTRAREEALRQLAAAGYSDKAAT